MMDRVFTALLQSILLLGVVWWWMFVAKTILNKPHRTNKEEPPEPIQADDGDGQ